jgi:AcrR family transcriptional regulator
VHNDLVTTEPRYPSEPEDCGESLRERKTRERRHAIHAAAVDLVGDAGLDAVTIAQIAERAEVSKRTFFNYFPSKEAAILDQGDHESDGSELRAFIRDFQPRRDDLAEDIAHVVRHAFEFVGPASATRPRVRALLVQYPQLVLLNMEAVRRFDEDIVAGVRDRIKTRGIEPADEARADRLARMLTLLCTVPLQHAFRSAKVELDRELNQEEMDAAFEESVAMFKTVIERMK